MRHHKQPSMFLLIPPHIEILGSSLKVQLSSLGNKQCRWWFTDKSIVTASGLHYFTAGLAAFSEEERRKRGESSRLNTKKAFTAWQRILLMPPFLSVQCVGTVEGVTRRVDSLMINYSTCQTPPTPPTFSQ